MNCHEQLNAVEFGFIEWEVYRNSRFDFGEVKQLRRNLEAVSRLIRRQATVQTPSHISPLMYKINAHNISGVRS